MGRRKAVEKKQSSSAHRVSKHSTQQEEEAKRKSFVPKTLSPGDKTNKHLPYAYSLPCPIRTEPNVQLRVLEDCKLDLASACYDVATGVTKATPRCRSMTVGP